VRNLFTTLILGSVCSDFVVFYGDTEFSGAITTHFCFTYTLDGITAMPRGLHARLCGAFLVHSVCLYTKPQKSLRFLIIFN